MAEETVKARYRVIPFEGRHLVIDLESLVIVDSFNLPGPAQRRVNRLEEAHHE